MDSILAEFDFTSTKHHPKAYTPRVGEDIISGIKRIEAAAAASDLPSLTTELEKLRNLPNSAPYLDRLGDSLYLAVHHKHYDILQYLLQAKAQITTTSIKAAVAAKDTTALDLLLKNGWDIDMQLGPATSSALAYVQDEHIWLNF